MELYQVKYFIALCETLNFTRAAEKCNVAQPSLTRAIQNLERELGGPLFHRERQNTHLTELGRLMQPYFEDMLSQTQAAHAFARSFANLDGISLRIGVMCTIGPIMVSDFLRSFAESHQGLDICVLDASAQALQSKLLNGEIEVAIYGMPELQMHDRLYALPLFYERFVVAVARDHPFAARETVRCRDLHKGRYINRINCEVYEAATAALQHLGVEVQMVFRSERDDWVQAMIAAGHGFGFFPEYCVTMPGIVGRPLVEPEMYRTVDLVTVRGRPFSPAVGAFVRAAKAFAWTPSSATPRPNGQDAGAFAA
jgi:DNA-binding transcriptional LysR family regulator